MTSTLIQPCPDTSRPPVENRVVGLGSLTASTTSATWSQVLESHQETADASTWIVSGVGEWLSKDRIGISGGINLFESFGNNPVNFLDSDGSKFQWLNGKFDEEINSMFIKVKKTAAGLALFNNIKESKTVVVVARRASGGQVGLTKTGSPYLIISPYETVGALAHEMQHVAEDICPEHNLDPLELGVVSKFDPAIGGDSEPYENRAMRVMNIVNDQYDKAYQPWVRTKPKTTYCGLWNVPQPFGTKYTP